MTLSAPSPSSERTAARARRLGRYARRCKVREAGAERAGALGSWESVSWRRQCSCGFAMGDDVGIAWSTSTGSCYPVGVSTCGSVWACVVCTAKIRTVRTRDVEHLAAWHASRGGSLIMLTLTVPHSSADPLLTLLDGLVGSYRALQQSAWWRSLRASWSGSVRTLEVTHGFADESTSNGWHPHLHVLLLVDASDAARLVAYLDAELPARWANSVVARLGEHHRPSVGHGIDVRNIGASAARYVTKIALEVTRSDLKSGSRQPWSFIDDGDWEHWSEYCAAMKGKRAVQWSRGLRDACGLGVDSSDEAAMLAFSLDYENGLVVARVERRFWNRLEAQCGTPALLAHYEERCRRARGLEPPAAAAA